MKALSHIFANQDPGRDDPDLLRIQPLPIDTRVVRFVSSNGDFSSVLRRWRPGDSERCRLCPTGKCWAQDDLCLIAVNRFVATDEAPLLDVSNTPLHKTAKYPRPFSEGDFQ